MKKIFSIVLMTAIVALLSAGCKDPDEPKPTPTPVGPTSWPTEAPACDAFTHQIVDGGFENQWFQPQGADYLEYQSSVFYTLNSLSVLRDIPAMQVTNAPITSMLDSVTPHSGKYAMKLTTGILRDAANGQLLIPGAIAPLNVNFVDEFLNSPDGINVKRPYTDKPTSISGYFKYTSVASDSASICVELYNGNTVIARGYFLQKTSVNSWTHFSAPIEYTDYANATPTHISIVVSSSAGYNFADLTNCQGQDGSTLWIDDLELGF